VRPDAAAADVELVQQRRGGGLDAPREHPAVARRGRLVEVVQHHVLGEAEVHHQAAVLAVGRDVAHAGVERLAGARAGDVPAVGGDRAGGGRPQAGDGVDQLGLPVAVDAGDADDLPRADGQRQPAHGLEAAVVVDDEVGDLQPRLGRPAGRLLDREHDVAADHQPREALLGRARGGLGGDVAPAPQHGHAVRDVEDLVELVGDEDHRRALRGQAAQDRLQLGRLLGRQHRGRLVEDQDLGAAVERLQDLHPLLHADRDVLDEGAGVDGEPEAVGDGAHARLGLTGVEERPAAGLDRQHDVLGDGHHRDEHEVLVHHADPERDGVARRVDRGLPAAHEDLALAGRGQAVEHVHQGRLAGAVLAEQGVDLAPAQVERDVVGGDDAGVALGDVAQLQHDLPRRLGRRGSVLGGRPVHGHCLRSGAG
jgi:hypothetical protein